MAMSEGDPEFFSDNKTHRLILGNSFQNNSHTAFHTVRYDFKPASVDQQQEGELEVGDTNEVTVSLPHILGSKTACTVYKGSKKPAQKECVLIFDHDTGEFTLERITSQVQVKKTRDSGNATFPSHPSLGPTAPKLPKVLPGMSKKPKSASANRGNSKKTERFHKKNEDNPYSTEIGHVAPKPLKPAQVQPEPETTEKQSAFSTDESRSSDSSSSSSSDDYSGSSSDENESETLNLPKPPITSSQLQEDLELSESGSDSD